MSHSGFFFKNLFWGKQMNKALRADVETIIHTAIQAVMPDEAVKRTLKDYPFN